MAESSPHRESEPTGWSTDSQIVREFDRPVRVSDAVIETLIEAVEDWPELSRSPPVFEFVDADKLDAIGSVGIARSFMLAGQFGQSIISQSSDEYVNSNIVENGRIKDVSKHSPFMEYEFKFKKIPSKLFTQKAIEIGKKRLGYMENYFTRLSKEIDGEL